MLDIKLLSVFARMAELADAPDSKSGSRKRVGVRPSLRAPPEGPGVAEDLLSMTQNKKIRVAGTGSEDFT